MMANKTEKLRAYKPCEVKKLEQKLGCDKSETTETEQEHRQKGNRENITKTQWNPPESTSVPVLFPSNYTD